MSNTKAKSSDKRYSSVTLLSEELGERILKGLKWPEEEKLKDWKITGKKQFHATLSQHGPVADSAVKKLKKVYNETSRRHDPIQGATLSLGNNFGNANQCKSGGHPHLLLLHLDPISHFKLTEYWMDLHRSLGNKFKQGRADRFMHFTLARVPYGQEEEALQFIKDNKDFLSEPFDLVPGLYSHAKGPEGDRGYVEEELFPLRA